MAEVWLVNPSKRPGVKAKKTRPKKRKVSKRGGAKMARKKPRSAAQKAATRKLVALNKSRAKKRVRRKNPQALSAVSSTKRKTPTKRKYARPSAASASKAGRTLRRYRKNPSGISLKAKSIIDNVIMPSAAGTVGALGTDLVMGYGGKLLPDAVKTGAAGYAVKGAISILIGLVATKVLPPRQRANAVHMANGGLTVAMHQLTSNMIKTNMPNIPLGDADTVLLGNDVGWSAFDDSMGAIYDSGMGELYDENMGAVPGSWDATASMMGEVYDMDEF